jgi:hypothetical protein
MLLIDDTSFKTCLNLPFNVIFVKSYEYAPKKDNYLVILFSHTYSSFIILGLAFPPLWSFILSAPSKVLKKTMLNFERCSKNAPWPILSIFVGIAQHL